MLSDSFFHVCLLFFFFFNDTATTEIYTLSLHDALPICGCSGSGRDTRRIAGFPDKLSRSEEHTSELQSRLHLVCPLLLEKKTKHKRPQRGRYKGRIATATRARTHPP